MGRATCLVVTRHLYGMGGGAHAVLCFLDAFKNLGYEVHLASLTEIAPSLRNHLVNVALVQYQPGMSEGYDLLFNIDHFYYEPPRAKLNTCFIFHPNEHNAIPEGYQKVASVSKFTQRYVQHRWDIESDVLYLPISRHHYQLRKRKEIIHVSRTARPQHLSDKGHIQLLDAFRMLSEHDNEWAFNLVGSLDPGQEDYLQELTEMARGLNVRIWTNPTGMKLDELYARSAVYWHLTGITMPEIPGAQEHLGLTTLEAMASGCVPIVLATGGQPEIVKHGLNGAHVRGIYDMVNMTLQLTEDWSNWANVSQNGLRVAERWQDWAAWDERVRCWLAGEEYELLPPMETGTYGRDDVCIVIPQHDNVQLTVNLISSLQEQEPGDYQVIVVDNASTENLDGFSQMCEHYGYTLLRRETNDGFGVALDAAAEYIDRPLVLALNNDMRWVSPHALKVMARTFDEGVGVVGAKLLYPDGTLQHAGVNIDFNRPDIGYHRWHGQPDGVFANGIEKVLAVTGAALMTRREFWKWKWDGFNYEDLNLCLDVKRHGLDVVYQPGACIVHFDGQTKAGKIDVSGNRDRFLEQWHKRILNDYPEWLHMAQLLREEEEGVHNVRNAGGTGERSLRSQAEGHAQPQ